MARSGGWAPPAQACFRWPSAAWGCPECTAPPTRSESIATIHAALDQGVTLLDTGDFYGMGHNELLIGRALRDRRDKALLSVKFGALRAPDGSWIGYDARPAAVKNFVAYSLVRLGVDHIDIYRPARLDPKVPDRGDDWRYRRTGQSRLCPGHRALGGRSGNHPPRPSRASHLRPSDRVFAGQPRAGGEDIPCAR